MTARAACLVAFLAVSVGAVAAAQPREHTPSSPPANMAAFSVGVDPAFIATAHYTRLVLDGAVRLRLGAELSLPLLLIGRPAGRVSWLAQGEWTEEDWSIHVAALPFAIHHSDDAGAFTGLGLELRCTPAWMLPWGLLGLDVGWQASLATHVQHSDLIIRTFDDRYPRGTNGVSGPRNGWYGLTAQRVRAGIRTTYRFDQRWAMDAAIGVLLAPDQEGALASPTLARVPLYFTLGAHARW